MFRHPISRISIGILSGERTLGSMVFYRFLVVDIGIRNLKQAPSETVEGAIPPPPLYFIYYKIYHSNPNYFISIFIL
jgi:hypothetical protein